MSLLDTYSMKLSIIIPAKNEAGSLKVLLPELQTKFPTSEIIVVNDGSTDSTAQICTELNVSHIDHPYSIGNGGAIKSGARVAKGDVFIFMDGDGQHRVNDIPNLLNELQNGFDMVVGARGMDAHAGKRRLLGNKIYNLIASKIVGQNIEDLTSGFRAVRAAKFREFLYLLPNGFSYPTTITMAFFRTGYTVTYVPINTNKRLGSSHLKLLKDGPKFFVIILKIAALYSPLKIFTPISATFLMLALLNYGYTFYNYGTFTNMSALLMIISVLLFVMGLIAEQITILMYAIKTKEK